MIIKYFNLYVDNYLSIGYYSKAGRNCYGRICIHHRGGGLKRRYRYIDYFRRLNQWGNIIKIFRKSFHTSLISLILYENGLATYMPLSYNLNLGDRIYSGYGEKMFIYDEGTSLPLYNIKLFSMINNVELYPYSGSKICRAAGVCAILISRINGIAILKLNSGWLCSISDLSFVTLGRVSNISHKLCILGKAGRKRLLGIRPVVRGIVKNPCDHPHGGGEGKGSPPVAAKSPWGWLTKGTPSKCTLVIKKYRQLYKK